MFTSIGKGLYGCVSDSGNNYLCDLENKTCNCKGFYYGQKRDNKGSKLCKHLVFLGVKT